MAEAGLEGSVQRHRKKKEKNKNKIIFASQSVNQGSGGGDPKNLHILERIEQRRVVMAQHQLHCVRALSQRVRLGPRVADRHQHSIRVENLRLTNGRDSAQTSRHGRNSDG